MKREEASKGSDKSERSDRSDASDESDRSDGPDYRGRLAPTPSGWLHLGHAATFQTAWQRARERNGTLIFRMEDIDPYRCRPEYLKGAIEDLIWWGLDWDEGPDKEGPYAPYLQSQRTELYRTTLEILRVSGFIYPSPHSRKEIEALSPERSPVDGDTIFPASLRREPSPGPDAAGPTAWRFRVPDGREIRFTDGRTGEKRYTAGVDFGDFLIWRKEDVPAYELAVVVDDHAMDISEVVRGEDLLLSTARQLLVYEALQWNAPAWYHCPLVVDPATGQRMSKTHRSLGLKALRESGHAPGLEPARYF
jgi:glutamyl-tRNA synthetase